MKIEIQDKLIKYLRSLITRCLIVVIIFLGMAICSKKSEMFKDMIVENVYEDNISFVEIKQFYTKYFGGVVPLEQGNDDVSLVFNEELDYKDESVFYDGVKLMVNKNYLIPVIEEGMVMYIGEKENYGNVVIIEGIDGINIWYGNINRVAVKLYDYVNVGSYLGETVDDKLYLVYEKDNEFLDYREYLG